MTSEKKINEIKSRYSLDLLNQKGVSGVGVEKDGKENFVLTIHLNNSSPEAIDLPKELEKYPVKFIDQDEGFRKLPAKDKVRG